MKDLEKVQKTLSDVFDYLNGNNLQLVGKELLTDVGDAHRIVENLAIHDVVFNEAEDCRKCLKPKRMKPNTIQMLCECVDSEVKLFCRVCKSDNIKHHPEEYYECLGCGHEFTK